MQCPACNVPLTMSERQGVEIDYCPQCRGVWLDRGELDKILERSRSIYGEGSGSEGGEPERSRHREAPSREWEGHGYPRKKRKESWLEDLFD